MSQDLQMQNIWATVWVRGHDTSLLCCAIYQTLTCRLQSFKAWLFFSDAAYHSECLILCVCVPFCPCFTSYSTQLHIVIVMLPVVPPPPPLRHFSQFRIVGRKYRSDSFRGTSIYIFDKYLPQIISVQYHYLSASLVGNSLSLDLSL